MCFGGCGEVGLRALLSRGLPRAASPASQRADPFINLQALKHEDFHETLKKRITTNDRQPTDFSKIRQDGTNERGV
jgi:hypothetical protein